MHPPLYFWLLDMWRRLVGPSWFAARLLSVAFTVAALAVLGRIAVMAKIPVVPTILVALLTYGFAYTGIVARGFALAQLCNVVGLACLFAASRERRRVFALAAGIAFGAASLANYLAIFTGCAALVWLLLDRKNWRLIPAAGFGLALFLPADAWFFLAQRSSRVGQFTAFSWRHAVPLMAKDFGAALFGGLPIYAGGLGPLVTVGLALLVLVCAAAIVRRWRRPSELFGLAAAATPAGLLALGVVFHNTPIEIRYLAFSTPYLALLAAMLPRGSLGPLLAVETCAIIGLALAPGTMQSQAAAARAAAAIAAPNTLVLVPFGNDGVGIPGPFVTAAPAELRIALIGPDQTGARRAAPSDFSNEPEMILALIEGDNASRVAVTSAQAWFAANRCWQKRQQTRLIAVYLNRCPQQQP